MNVSWTSHDPFDAAVVDKASGQVLFNLATSGFVNRVTTMTDAGGQVVAKYERRLGYDRVTYQGQTHTVSDWLPKNGFFTSSRRLRAPNGKEYLWKEKNAGKFKLVDAHSKVIVAETHADNWGILAPKHNMGIDAGPEVVPFMDLIVLSLVICEHERRARQRARSNANAARTAGAR